MALLLKLLKTIFGAGLALALLGPRSLRFDPLLLLRELASMLRAGMPLAQAFGQIADGHRLLARHLLRKVQQRLEQGEPLSRALRSLPRRWAPEAVLAMVAAGERSGRLPELLEELAGEMARLYQLDRRVRTLLIYPLVVLQIAGICLYVISWKVLPVFSTLHASMGGELPLLTRLFQEVWRWIGMAGWILPGLALLHLLLTLRRPLRFGRSTVVGRWLAWRLPVVRGLRRSLLEIRFARTLRLLVEAGVPLPDALDHCEAVVADDHCGEAIVAAARRIRDGEQPSRAFRMLTFLSPAFVWFLADSERRGDFLDVTRVMTQAAEDRFMTRMEVVERLVEPIATVTVGLLIGLAVIGIYQAMFNLTNLAGKTL